MGPLNGVGGLPPLPVGNDRRLLVGEHISKDSVVATAKLPTSGPCVRLNPMLHKVATSWAALPADVTRSVVVRGTEEACEPAWVIRTSIHGMHAASQLTAAGDPNVSEATITQKRGRTGELDVHLITTQPDATHPRCLVVAQAIQPTLQAWSALPSTVRSRVVFRTGTIPTCDGRGSLAAAFEQLGKIRFVPSTHAAPSVARYWLRSPYDFFERP